MANPYQPPSSDPDSDSIDDPLNESLDARLRNNACPVCDLAVSRARHLIPLRACVQCGTRLLLRLPWPIMTGWCAVMLLMFVTIYLGYRWVAADPSRLLEFINNRGTTALWVLAVPQLIAITSQITLTATFGRPIAYSGRKKLTHDEIRGLRNDFASEAGEQ